MAASAEEDAGDINFTVVPRNIQHFVKIPEDDFAHRAVFLLENRELIGSQLELLLKEAVTQFRADNVPAAKQCLVSMIIINAAKYLVKKENLRMETQQTKDVSLTAYALCKSQLQRKGKPSVSHSSMLRTKPWQLHDRYGHQMLSSVEHWHKRC